MAGDWLKMRIDLVEDPAVIGMAIRLGLDEFAVVGRLHKLWGWANRQSIDGHAAGITADWIDRYVAQSGFADAMKNVGWLEFGPEGAQFPNFDRHNGQSAKSRALGRERQEHCRAKASRLKRDENVTREEKEKTNTPQPPACASAGFDALSNEYPAHRRNIGPARRQWEKINPDEVTQACMLQAARYQARSAAWQAEDGKRVPNLSKWLANEGWRATHDERAPAAQQPVGRDTPQPSSVALSEQQLQANKAKAAAAAELARKVFAEKELRHGTKFRQSEESKI